MEIVFVKSFRNTKNELFINSDDRGVITWLYTRKEYNPVVLIIIFYKCVKRVGPY